MAYNDDKRELLKLKQGLITESETIVQDAEKPDYNLKGWAWVKNFFYRNGWLIPIVLFLVAAVVFFTVTTLQAENGDIKVLVITKNDEISGNVMFKIKDFEQGFEKYCPDYDDSGYIHVDTYDIDLSENADPNYTLANVSKLSSELMYGDARIFVVDKAGIEAATDGKLDQLVNLEELYPDCEYIDGIYLNIKASNFDSACNYVETCPEDLYIVLRKVSENSLNPERENAAQKKALEVIDNIIKGKFAGWEDDQGRIYGMG